MISQHTYHEANKCTGFLLNKIRIQHGPEHENSFIVSTFFVSVSYLGNPNHGCKSIRFYTDSDVILDNL